MNDKAPTFEMKKVILYVDRERMTAIGEFYHDTLGLPYIVGPNDGWMEFDTGSCSLCVHDNTHYEDEFTGRPTRCHITLYFGTGDKSRPGREYGRLCGDAAF